VRSKAKLEKVANSYAKLRGLDPKQLTWLHTGAGWAWTRLWLRSVRKLAENLHCDVKDSPGCKGPEINVRNSTVFLVCCRMALKTAMRFR
jgi:hypothetical protein